MVEPRGRRDPGTETSERPRGAAPAAEADLPAVRPGELEAVRRIFVCFGKTARIIQLYPSNNRLFVDATSELHEVFREFLAEHGELELDVDECRFLYKGRPMHEEPVRARSIPFRLYVDGIRRLSFTDGLSREELLSLLEVLGHPPPPENSEDDVVTILWEKDFTHIQYLVADLDTTEEPPDLTHEIKASEPTGEDGGEDEVAGGEGRPKKRPRPLPPEILKKVLPVSDQDRQALHDLLDRERRRNLRHDLTTLLFEMLDLSHDRDSLEDAVGVLGLLLRSFVRAGDIGEGLTVLRKLRERAAATTDGEQKALLEAEIARCGGRDVVDALGAALEKPGRSGAQELMEFIDLLGPAVLTALVDIVPRIADEGIAREIVMRIARIDPGPLIALLSAPDQETVRRIVAAIGATREPSLAEWLLPLTHHDRPPVRVEVLRALARLGGEKSRSGLVRCLGDPDLQVRLQAARAVAEAADPALLSGMLGVLESRDFRGREFLERQEVLKAAARVGRNAVVPYLTRMLDAKGWLNRGRRDQLRACAATALGFIPTPEARRVVAERLSGATGLVAEALRISLRRIDEALGHHEGGQK